MKLRWVVTFIIAGLTSLHTGCWYSPWENLAYEVVDAPISHMAAYEALIGRDKHVYETYRFDDVICNIMLKGEGPYTKERGPYTIWVSFAEKHNAKSAFLRKTINVRGVKITSSGKTLWKYDGFPVMLIRHEVLNLSHIMVGDKKLILPNILNPKDGKTIQVIIAVETKTGEDKLMSFSFHPKITRGSIVLFD